MADFYTYLGCTRYGKYRFDVDAGLCRIRRRPLRQPQELPSARA
jgi:hypothetical protein